MESLESVWLVVSAVALVRVRQRRFDEDRAWMIFAFAEWLSRRQAALRATAAAAA